MESATMHQLTSSSTSLHQNAFPSAKKVAFGWQGTRVAAGRQHRYTSYCLCNYRPLRCLRHTGIPLRRNESSLLHALPLETVMTDSGSEGSTSPFLSVEYAGMVEADQGSRQSVPYKIQDWYVRARKPGVLVVLKQVVDKLNTELQTAEKYHLLQEINSSRWTRHGKHLMEWVPAWIKWPMAIFLPWFLLVSAFYGTSASMDLLPLWIIGPLIASVAVKAGMKVFASCSQWAADRKLKEGALHVIEGVRTGHLPARLIGTTRSRYVEAKLQIIKSTSEFILFIRSGAIIVALRQYMRRKLVERWEVWADRWEDWRLVYLRLERTMKNIV